MTDDFGPRTTAANPGPILPISGTHVSSAKDNPDLRLDVAIGWAIGSVGTTTLLALVSALILKYVVDYLLLSAAIAGVIMTVTRLFDAALDPFMGLLSDNTESRWGRRRPYLLVGGVLCGIIPALLFSDPFGIATIYPAMYMAFGLSMLSIAATVFAVPYITMSYELTSNRKERTTLMSFRVYGMAAGALIAQAVSPWIVTRFGGGIEGFAVMGWVISLIVLVTCLLSFVMTKNARVVDVDQSVKKPRLRDMSKAFGNKPFTRLIISKSFYVFGTGIQAAALAFFLTQALGQSLSILGLLSAALLLSVILSQPVWVWVCNRIGKRNAFLLAAPFNILANLSWLLSGPDESYWIFVARGIAIGLAGGGMQLAIQSLLPDTLEHETKRGGVSQEGVLSGLFTTIERGVSASSIAAAGFLISLGGYVAGASDQSDQAIWMLYFCVGVAPAIGITIAALVLHGYSLEN